MHKKFNHEEIEKKWQAKWKESGIYDVGERNELKEKEYVLVELPYPSGNLHVGHWFAFAVVDIYVRARRMQGKQVVFPIGFDAFGLPAENAAIKRNLDPKAWTETNIAYMKKQLESMGNAFSWDKTTNTTDPEYYKWTQWMFTQFFENDIAYRGTAVVNWCPGCNTVIANEQVMNNNTCERSGDIVEKRTMPQWMLRITKYADRLIDDLDSLDWPTHIKESQRQWIGRSKGAKISFALTLPSFQGEIVFATNNAGKVARMRKLALASGLKIVIKTPEEIGIANFKVIEDQDTLEGNVEKKVRELSKLTQLPVLADDSGFYIEGEECNPVMVKRNALGSMNEQELTTDEVGIRIAEYYKDIATKHGGTVHAEWRNALCFAIQGSVRHVEAVRPVILTNEIQGAFDPHLPLRSMYKPVPTSKYVCEQSEEEELLELKPITDALHKLLTPSIDVFTTRPDTLYGATYLVLAPEHPWVTRALDDTQTILENKEEVANYVKIARDKSEIERTNAAKEKTGVELKGVRAINPATGKEIPLYVADYVLSGYGTGAIMAVPAHDERDFAFAKKFNLPVTQVIVPCTIDSKNPPQKDLPEVKRDTVIVHVRDKSTGKYALLKWHNTLEGITTAIMGGIESEQTPESAALAEIAEEAGFTNVVIVKHSPQITAARYCASHKSVNRCAHSHVVLAEIENANTRTAVSPEEETLHTLIWVNENEVLDSLTPDHQKLVWKLLHNDIPLTGDGYLIHSETFDGMDSEEAKEAITKKVGGKMLSTYRLRDWSVGRQRYWGVPIPIVYDPEGTAHVVPKKHLPWLLPTDVDFTPTGEPPLAKSEELKERTERIFGKGWTPEVETMDTFVDSSWYFLRYIDNTNTTEFTSLNAQKKWMPIDIYFGGSEHTTMHVLYSRFWQKALYDLGLVHHDEPYTKRLNRGLVLDAHGNKMSKSKGNTIDPDEQVKLLGADTVKMYLAFMGPYGEPTNYPWDTGGIAGLRRFLERVYGLHEHIGNSELPETTKLLHKTIVKVSQDISIYKFNTAISALMILVNHIEKVGCTQNTYETFLRLLAPFAPHITEELWDTLSKEVSIHCAEWPSAQHDLLIDDTVTISVQINGKMRGTITAPIDASESAVMEILQTHEDYRSKIGTEIKKSYFVPNKIISLIN